MGLNANKLWIESICVDVLFIVKFQFIIAKSYSLSYPILNPVLIVWKSTL